MCDLSQNVQLFMERNAKVSSCFYSGIYAKVIDEERSKEAEGICQGIIIMGHVGVLTEVD